jgi:hypothetical protein
MTARQAKRSNLIMKRLPLYVLLIFLITATSVYFNACKKDKNKITINGKVYDPNSKSYVSNASVTISSSRISSGFYNSNYTDIDNTLTDANGNFSFEFNKEKSGGYRFYVNKDKYFEITADIPDDDIVPGTPYTPVFNLYSEAYLKLHVKNSAPWNNDDFIAYYYTQGYLDCFECCSEHTNTGTGMLYDSTFRCKTYGSQNVIINWHVTKMGSDIAYSDTVFCLPFDTTFFEILY